MKNETVELSNWIRKQILLSNTRGAVVGLSGGIDSSVVASLCVKAIGKEKVRGVIMPCNNSDTDYMDAIKIANQLDINISIVNLKKTFNKLRKEIFQIKEGSLLTEANIKARLRMTTLYAIANELNYLVVGTGNKSELEIGYYTKYGDGGVDIEPLNDFYKTEVYKIAEELNIPKSIINKKPSAGLWKDQTDEAEIGCSYKELDLFLQGNKVESMSKEQEDRINTLIKNTQHKREMPPMYIRRKKI